MLRRPLRWLGAMLLVLLAAACSAPPSATPAAQEGLAPTPSLVAAVEEPTSTPLPPVPSSPLRFALVGQPARVNAWSLFDDSGASYANYALRYGEYPSLYRLSVPGREFEPYIAQGLPSAISEEGGFFTAAVSLPPGLYWSDGSPLTAADVAFTVNSALAFRLRLDWSSAYDPSLLDRVEAPDDQTVRFYFKKPLDVSAWQYGALQGPILNQAYWLPRMAETSALLPAPELLTAWEQTRAEADELQADIDNDNALLFTGLLTQQGRNEVDARIRRNQDELNSLHTKTARLQDQFNAALEAARRVLFALPDDGEPTFGPYLRYVESGELFTRSTNPSYPFEKPVFARLSYALFPDEQAALTAFEAGSVDVVLSPRGLPPGSRMRAVPNNRVTFLALNPARTELTDPALRRALACVIDPHTMVGEGALPFGSFVPSGPWSDNEQLPPCLDMPAELRIQNAAQILNQAGYTWRLAPAETPGAATLILPGGFLLRPLVLLTTAAEDDPLRFQAAQYIAQQAGVLGISTTLQALDPHSLRYAVYSTAGYDLALLSWRLGEYPAYLCDWFLPPAPFTYQDERLQAGCQSMRSTADLPAALQAAYEIQSALLEDLPLIPLYQGVQYEAIQNVTYPFDSVENGISGLYGAPELAVPSY